MIDYTKLIPYIIIAALLAIILIPRACEGETTTVTIPEQKGEFEAQKPVYITQTDTVYRTKWKTATDTIEISTENPVNDSLVLAYQNLQDSLERFKMYLDAIQIRKFKNTFEDEYLELTISGEVQGKLNWIKPDYKIKERTIEVPQKPFSISAFAGYGVSKSGLSPMVGVGVSYDLFSF